MKKHCYLTLALACMLAGEFASRPSRAAETIHANGHTLTVSGKRFMLDGEPFPYTGISFFNAIYNPAFNTSSAERLRWLGQFQKYGINALRVWCQWDNKMDFVDTAADHTLYHIDGRLRSEPLATLRGIISDADSMGMVVLVTLFQRESWDSNIRLSPSAMDAAVAGITRELMPHRNVAFQIWNEYSERVLECIQVIRDIDPNRLVTNAPGYAGELGDAAQNTALNFLSPHTSRQTAGKPWEVAPKEIGHLLELYKKPVVDDEPARNGTSAFGGPKTPTSPADHILQIYKVWELGGYVIYHHDMFQNGYGSQTCPPSGVPDPEFNPYHRRVLEFIAMRNRYMQEDRYSRASR